MAFMPTHRCSPAPGSPTPARRRRPAFSLVELAVVLAIVAIIAAIAVPRVSQASKSATTSYVEESICVVRRAIELYYAEHGCYPGYHPSTGSPNGEWFVKQLLEYSNEAGDTRDTHGYPYIYGPYVRSPFPANPFNDLRTVGVKANPSGASPTLHSTGWIAVLSTGEFGINASAAQIQDLEVSGGGVKLLAGGGGAAAL